MIRKEGDILIDDKLGNASDDPLDLKVALGYVSLMELNDVPLDYLWWYVRFVKLARQDEPRISCGAHYLDYIMICDEDDDMDSFYGPDYFKPNAKTQ